MISGFGHLFLYMAMFFSLSQALLPLLGYWRNNRLFSAMGKPAMQAQGVSIIGAYLLLVIGFICNDFSINYIAANSHPDLPLWYRISAVWGGHEGSLLWWIVVLNGWSLLFLYLEQEQPLVYAMLGILTTCFLGFLLFTSNPFLLATVPQTAQDLNPLLQDPGFILHPPLLYVGYVGFAVAFAITQAALLAGKLDTNWAALTRHYAIAAWCFLTLGIALGSWWAYRVLGWGGFWFWDPVENASLLPWLAGTALIHVLLLAEKRKIATNWAALLTIITFALSLIGTFLVRSGVLVSVHTFANDPTRGIFLLAVLAIVMTAALINYVRGMMINNAPSAPPFAWLSREMSLLVNSGLLTIAMLTVLLGTLYPLIVDAFGQTPISVGAPYFNTVMTPLLFCIMIAMVIGPLCRWEQSLSKTLYKKLVINLGLSLVTALLIMLSIIGKVAVLATLHLTLSFWIILSALYIFRLRPGMTLAHVGFAVMIIGILLSSYLNQEQTLRLKPGLVTEVGPYRFAFRTTERVNGTNYEGIRAIFNVFKRERFITTLTPEKRIYPVRGMVMTKVDIHPGLFRDLYIALGEPLDDAYWSVRIYYKPFIRWIWLGALCMLLGGACIFLERRQQRTT